MAFNPNEHLIPLKGKDYLQVMWRLVWFRDEKPNWSIDTKLEHSDENSAVFSAKIFDENGIQKSSGYGSETKRDFGDFLEKAETKAVGRALAMLGYGTQFAPELDEENRIVDSPVEKKDNTRQTAQNRQEQPKTNKAQYLYPPEKDKPVLCEQCGKRFPDYTDGKTITKAVALAADSRKKYGKALCPQCTRSMKNGMPQG